MNTVHFPEQVIPEYSIVLCSDCPYFSYRGASYGDGHTCDHIDGPTGIVTGDDIPDNCPLLKEEDDS